MPNICARVSREDRILWVAWVEEVGLTEGVGFRGSGNSEMGHGRGFVGRVLPPLRVGQVFVDAVPLSPGFFRKPQTWAVAQAAESLPKQRSLPYRSSSCPSGWRAELGSGLWLSVSQTWARPSSSEPISIL